LLVSRQEVDQALEIFEEALVASEKEAMLVA
jgi:hypothetical protein